MFSMRNFDLIWILIVSIGSPVLGSKCGCKTLTTCYVKMLDMLHDQDEAYCVEDAAIGTSTLTVYLRAISEYCMDFVNVSYSELITYDARHLYEVTISLRGTEEEEKQKPTIIIDAGQEAGTESVGFGLYIIEQLVACQESKDMIQKVKWVIMPSTNPDGLEFARYRRTDWKKNLRLADDEISYGVDISRNFDTQWGACQKNLSPFSPEFPGPEAASENETIFIKDTLNKHVQNAKIYLSIKRDGHYIGYPNAYSKNKAEGNVRLSKVAAEVAAKVNLRTGGIYLFENKTLYELQGKAHCGHSVDYANSLGIPLAFEMRVFLGTDNRIMSKFQTLPRGYESSLRNGYYSGIRELYNVIVNEKKYPKIFTKRTKY